MATRGPSGPGGKAPSALPDLTDDDDADLDQDTAISDPAAMRQLLGSSARAQTETSPAGVPMRPTPVPQRPAPGMPAAMPRNTPVHGSAPQGRPTPQPPQRNTPNPSSRATQHAFDAVRPPAAPAPRAPEPPAPAPAAPPRRPTGPKLLQTTDIVPEFRRDLQIQRVAGGVQVVDPVSGTGHALNEYEVSLARMLNGKRPVFEVIEASERLGIPINVESLQKFIAKLEMQGLLQPPESLDSAIDKAWPSRGQWESNVRTLFQSGIRFLRQGKHEEAIGYFEALLAEDPDNVEAKELLEMSKQAVSAPVPTVVVPPPSAAISIPGYHMTPSGPVPVVPQQYPQGQPAPYADPSGLSPYPQQPTPHGYPQQTGTSQQYAAQPYPQQPYAMPPAPAQAAAAPLPKKTLLLGLGALVVVGALIGFIFLHKSGSKPAASNGAGSGSAIAMTQTGSDTKVEPNAGSAKVVPSAGSGKTAPEAGSAKVDSGSAKTSDGSAAVKPDGSGDSQPDDGSGSAKTDVGSGSAKTDAGSGSAKAPPDDGAPAGPATNVSAPTGGDVTAYLKAPRNVKKGEKLFAITTISGDPAKIKELSAKVSEMEKLAKQDPDTYKEFLTTARKDLAAVRKVNTTIVTAPKAGKATPKVKNNGSVRNGQVMAVIE